MINGKISKLVVVITSKETGEHVERWQFDVQIFSKANKSRAAKKGGDQENAAPRYTCPCSTMITLLKILSDANTASSAPPEKTEAEIQEEIQAIFRQITASVTFLPVLDGDCTFNVLVYADADSDVPIEWGDSDAKEIKNGEKVQLRSFSTSNHKVDTIVSYRLAD